MVNYVVQPQNLARRGPTPLSVIIHGNGPASGKTSLQFLLADFLKSRGHAIHVSDDRTEDYVFKRSATIYRKQPDSVVPTAVYLHVSSEQVTNPTSALAGRTPLRW
jgi:hypothetical protein